MIDGTLRYHDVSGRTRDDSINEQMPTPPGEWKKIDTWTNKYVDDLNIAEHHYLNQATSIITTRREKKKIHAEECQRIFGYIKENCEKIGMKVNDAKTQLLCVSANRAVEAESFVEIGGTTITSQPALKILGFMMDSEGGMGANVAHTAKKFYAALWKLRHLKRVGIPEDELTKIYSTTL